MEAIFLLVNEQYFIINKFIAGLKISQLNQDISVFCFGFLNFVLHNKKTSF
jgi:hypothetical protein